MRRSVVYGLMLILLLSCQGRISFAQDRIVKISNDTVLVKIVGITVDKIRFRPPGMKSGPISEIQKNQVKEIIYEDGSRMTIVFNLREASMEYMVPKHFHIIKFDFASPFLNHYTLGFEYNIKTGTNLEVKGGWIGPGLSKDLTPASGFLVKAGVKFVKTTRSIIYGRKFLHPMKGNYLKPELIFSRFTLDEDSLTIDYQDYALGLMFGRQFMLDKSVSLEYFGGFGVGYQQTNYQKSSDKDRKETDFNYAYSHLFLGKNFPLILTGGLTIGFMF